LLTEDEDLAFVNHRDQRSLTNEELVMVVDQRRQKGGDRHSDSFKASRDALSGKTANQTAELTGTSPKKVEKIRAIADYTEKTGDMEERDAVLQGQTSRKWPRQSLCRKAASAGGVREHAGAFLSRQEHANLPTQPGTHRLTVVAGMRIVSTEQTERARPRARRSPASPAIILTTAHFLAASLRCHPVVASIRPLRRWVKRFCQQFLHLHKQFARTSQRPFKAFNDLSPLGYLGGCQSGIWDSGRRSQAGFKFANGVLDPKNGPAVMRAVAELSILIMKISPCRSRLGHAITFGRHESAPGSTIRLAIDGAMNDVCCTHSASDGNPLFFR
jgi:hypothetical protein